MIIDKRSRAPIYAQIINYYKTLIACGALKTGDQFESVRNLSRELGINPNTIQKAYSELESQFICYSSPGKGRFVTADAKNIIRNQSQQHMNNIEKEVFSLTLKGVSRDEILKSVASAITKAQNKIENIKPSSE